MRTSFENRSWKLSKTSFVSGKQCVKQLYLDTFKKNEKSDPSEQTKVLWNRGREFEALVRREMFPAGIDVKEATNSRFNLFCSYTDDALRNTGKISLFEASLIEDRILVMIDMLHMHADGMLDFYEIKLHRELTEGILWDLSIQYYVALKKFGDRIRSFQVILRKGEQDWEVTDVRELLEKNLEETDKTGKEYIEFLEAGVEPVIPMGQQCELPYSCGFKEYCMRKQVLA